jgi:plastocyanin
LQTPTEDPTAPAPEETAAPGSTAPRAADAVYITVTEFAFRPSLATAKVGQVIVWSFEGSLEHELDFGPRPGAPRLRFREGQFSRREQVAMTFEYSCAIHPEMRGTVVVEP